MNYNVLFEKLRAKKALKGNWQTALVLVFFASVFVTIQDVVTVSLLPSFSTFAYRATVHVNYDVMGEYVLALQNVPIATWGLYTVIGLLSFVLTPALMLGSNWYFINRLEGKELGIQGLFSRLKHWFPALRLVLLMGLLIFLWSLLLVVPGIIAAIRYSMAPYFMAQDPSLNARQALAKSKEAMKKHKMHYALLLLSFIGWYFLSLIAQNLLLSFGVVIALMGVQFINLFIATYQSASLAAFYHTVSCEGGCEKVTREMETYMRSMGFTPPVKTEETPDILDEEPTDDEEKK